MGGPVLLGPHQAWEAATWGKQLSQPYTLAAFPWLHCVLAPKGSVALSTAGTALALTLKATPPGPQQLPVDPTSAELNSATGSVPLLGRIQSWVRGWEHGGKTPGRWRGRAFVESGCTHFGPPKYHTLSFQGRGQ